MQTQDIPTELLDLEKSYGEIINSKSKDLQELASNYSGNLYLHTSPLLESENLNVQRLLIKYWFLQLHINMEYKNIPDLLRAPMDKLIELMVKHEDMLNMIVNSGKIEVIANLCLKRARLYSYGYEYTDTNYLHKLLEKITRTEIEIHITHSLKSMTDFLYGPACWTLYREETNSGQGFIKHLWHSNLPIVGLLNNIENTTVSLPISVI